MLLCVLILTLSAQSSSLWRRLILIPSSVLLMFGFRFNIFISGFVTYLFMIVFIGGLIVLLVSVASTTQQEQGTSLRVVYAIISVLLFFLLKERSQDSLERPISFIMWLDYNKRIILLLCFLVLIVGLIVITWIILEFKGITRSV